MGTGKTETYMCTHHRGSCETLHARCVHASLLKVVTTVGLSTPLRCYGLIWIHWGICIQYIPCLIFIYNWLQTILLRCNCAASLSGYRHSPCCSAAFKPSKVYPILITGTPRSGTVFTQMYLNKLGIRVSTDWEGPYTDGMVSCTYDASL